MAPDGTPMANVLLSGLQMLGMDDVEQLGNSTGEFSFSSESSAAK